jgi:putative ABC transport system permease protein
MAAGMSDEKPGKEIRWPSQFTNPTAPHPVSVAINTTETDENYLPALGFHLLAGRNFSRQYKTDGRAVILSSSAIRALGFAHPADAVDKPLKMDGGDYTIVGVVNDFHQLSLQSRETPSAFQFGGNDLREFEYYFIRLRAAGMDRTIDHIRTAWNNSFRDNPFEYTFLDESFNSQYQSEIRFGLIFGAFSLLAIGIACIGLLGLVAFMVRQRTKEIGVRKVLGAGVKDILALMATDFARLIALAVLIAWPLGWLLMNSWLKDFAYRIRIHWAVFVLSGAIAFFIALATIFFQALKAATENPVNSLRTD